MALLCFEHVAPVAEPWEGRRLTGVRLEAEVATGARRNSSGTRRRPTLMFREVLTSLFNSYVLDNRVRNQKTITIADHIMS